MPTLDGVVRSLGRWLAWAFLAIAIIIGYEVVSRYLFGAPTFWAHEISGLLAAFAFLYGGAFCMAERGHLRIGLFADGLGRGWRRVAELLGLLCGAIYTLGLAVAAWNMSQKSLFRGLPDGPWMPERSGTSWNTPAPGFIKFALCVAAVLFLAVILARVIALLRGAEPQGEPAPD